MTAIREKLFLRAAENLSDVIHPCVPFLRRNYKKDWFPFTVTLRNKVSV